MFARPGEEHEISIFKDIRSELEVKSETLLAHLSPFRAVLSKKKPIPFTSKDMELRKRVIELYPHERPTPFPWEFSKEPHFETVEKKK